MLNPSVRADCSGSDRKDTPESVEVCWRPRGKNNTRTPYTVEDRGTGGLAPPAVHHVDIVGLPAPEMW